MKVDLRDGSCRECGGPLDIIDVDDVSIIVACTECSHIYPVEPDAFGLDYWPQAITEKLGNTGLECQKGGSL